MNNYYFLTNKLYVDTSYIFYEDNEYAMVLIASRKSKII